MSENNPTKEDVQSVLDGVHNSLLELLQRVELASAQLDTVADEELPTFIDEHVCDAKDTYHQQIDLWRQLLPNSAQFDAVQQDMEDVEGDTARGRRANLKERLMAMGATPALGNGMALPKTSSRQLSSLHVTASPASREMFLNKHGVELHTPGGRKTPAAQQSAPWLDELKSKKVSSAVHTPDTVNKKNLSDELGQAFAARAQRAGSTSGVLPAGEAGGDKTPSSS